MWMWNSFNSLQQFKKKRKMYLSNLINQCFLACLYCYNKYNFKKASRSVSGVLYGLFINWILTRMHTWNTHFCSPYTHQYGSPRVSHVYYRTSFFSALNVSQPLLWGSCVNKIRKALLSMLDMGWKIIIYCIVISCTVYGGIIAM